jgi:tetratricopeptide (TPR) repeat protein
MIKQNLDLNQLLDLSNKALQNKDYVTAKKLLEKVIVINEEIPEVYNNLGIIYLNSKNIKNSINYFEQAIKLNPKFSMAYCNLGLAYNKINQFDKASENYLKAIESDPKNIVAYFNIGNLFKFKGDLDQAEKNFNKAINLNPNMIMAYNNLFEIFDRSNQFKKLENILNKAKQKFGDHPLVNFFVGIYEYKKKNYNEVIKIYEKIVLDKNDIGRITVKNELLAKSYDHIGNYDKAYESFQSANNQINSFFQKKYNKENYINFINKRNEYFTLKNVKSWVTEKEDEKETPIFLIGFPRSGTTLLDTILRSHPKVEVLEEKPVVDIFIRSLGKEINNDLNNLGKIGSSSVEKLRQIYFDNRNKYINFDSKKIYIDKMPLNLIHVGEIVRIFPSAKFIFAIRNPYDVILSCFMQQFSPNDAMANLTNFDDATNLYDLVMNLWLKYNEILSIKVQIVRYENVVENFNESINNLLNFLGLEWDDKVKEYYKTAENRGMINTPSYNQVNMPLYNKSINRWKNYENKFLDNKKILNKWTKKFDY